MTGSTEATRESERPGLRERKAAATRLALSRALSDRLRTRSLSEITADEIAEHVGVSRVTFFNYFASKEAAIEHVLVRWMYEQQCEVAAMGLRGLAALEQLFRATGAFVQEGPWRAPQILSWFVVSSKSRAMPVLTRAEREMIAGDATPVDDQQSLGAMLEQFLAQAREDGDLALESSDYEMAHMLGALLFGSCIVGHSRPQQDWTRLYEHHLRQALGLSPATVSARSTRNAKSHAKAGAKAKPPAKSKSRAKAKGPKKPERSR